MSRSSLKRYKCFTWMPQAGIAAFLFLQFHACPAQFMMSTRSDTLNKKADAVVQYENESVTLSGKKTTIRIHTIVTIFNPNNTELAEFIMHYDATTLLKSFRGVITNGRGEILKKLKKSDLNDQASSSQFATDARLAYYEPMFDAGQFPLTIEYEYEIENTCLVNLPAWFPVRDFGVSVKHSTYSIACEDGNQVRFIEKNHAPAVKQTAKENQVIYTWTLNDFEAIEEEDFSPEIEDIAPSVFIAPTSLSFNEFTNDFKGWEDFGKWISKLNNGRDAVPDALKQKMVSLTKDLPSTRAKAEAVYKYMQSATRYVSIQFGIGGLQPMPASKVAENGYGDCKALSNFTVSLLRAAGVEAYYTLVFAGPYQNIRREFPSNQFNHVIVCVPDGKDTLWLECTSQKIAFGYLGNFTDDRDVLVISDAPYITHTKQYSASDNQTITNATVNITEEGDARVQMKILNSGLNSDYLFNVFSELNRNEQQQQLSSYFPVGNIEIENFSFTSSSKIVPDITLASEALCREYAKKSGSRLFVPLNILHPFEFEAMSDTARKLQVCQKRDYTLIDTVRFIVPGTYSIESKPATWKSESDFGSYECALEIDGKNILYTRKLQVMKGTYAPGHYPRLYDFYKNVALKDGVKLVLKKEL